MVITTRQIISKAETITNIFHDDDGIWQFLSDAPLHEEDAIIVSLDEIIQVDATSALMLNLPIGWVAWRADKDTDWLQQAYE